MFDDNCLQLVRKFRLSADALTSSWLAGGRLRTETHRRRGEGLHAQVAPGQSLSHQGRQAQRNRCCDLDRLKDYAIGETVGGADPEASVEDADHSELEDPDVRRSG